MSPHSDNKPKRGKAVLRLILLSVALIAAAVFIFSGGSPVIDREILASLSALSKEESASRYFQNGLASDSVICGDYAIDISGGCQDEITVFPLAGDNAGQRSVLFSNWQLRKMPPVIARYIYDGSFYRFLLTGGKLYVTMSSRGDDMGLYSYDLTDRSIELICRIPDLYVWTVLGDRLYYLESVRTVGKSDTRALHVRDLVSGDDRVIVPESSALGVVGRELRYVTLDGEEYRLFSYDAESGKSMLLGSLPASLGKNCQFFFTPEYLLMGRFGNEVYNYSYDAQAARKLIVYSVDGGGSAEYAFRNEIQKLMTSEGCVYVLAYNTMWTDRDPDVPYGVYRLDLSAGEEDLVCPIHTPGDLLGCTESSVYHWEYSLTESFIDLYRHDMPGGRETLFMAYR